MMEQLEVTYEDLATYNCAHCFEENEVVVDPSEGMHQQLVEDCWVCCHPNLVHIDIDADELRIVAYAESA
jgi:hypothetical protein